MLLAANKIADNRMDFNKISSGNSALTQKFSAKISSGLISSTTFVPSTELEGSMRCLVLMATYNGQAYLRDQIDSILRQTGVDVHILITDDCSSDNSYEIASEYASKDSRVYSRRNSNNKGVANNFMSMIASIDPNSFDYVAFSDQDDVWLKDKLVTAVKAINDKCSSTDAKKLSGIGTPTLYCSDLQNVNEHLGESQLELNRLNIDLGHRATPLLKNYFSGCTMVMNAAMVRLLQEYKGEEFPRIHDVWCSMVAYYCGNLVYDADHALILRRITGNNTNGAITAGKDIHEASLKHLAHASKRNISKSADLLYRTYSWAMSENDSALVGSFASYRSSIISRLKWVFSPDYKAVTFGETMLLRTKILLGRL